MQPGWVRLRCVDYRGTRRDGMWSVLRTRTRHLIIVKTDVPRPASTAYLLGSVDGRYERKEVYSGNICFVALDSTQILAVA